MSSVKRAEDKGGSRAAGPALIFREAPLWRVLAALCDHGYVFDELRRMTMQQLNEAYDSVSGVSPARRADAD